MGIVVRLTPVDERLLTPLLSVAVAETKPEEVMPPVEAPPGWSQPRREAFCEFYRSHCRGLNGPNAHPDIRDPLQQRRRRHDQDGS